jgi:glycerol-3-phosphate acyltransferase PlsX
MSGSDRALLPIALDAMGGDIGPSVNVEGAVAAVREDDQRVVLVGDEATVRAELDRIGGADLIGDRLSVRHAPEMIEMDEKPAAAVRKKKGSSMRVACDLVKAGEAAGAVSAGNSGAMMAVALLVHGRLPGVLRPCIAAAFPTENHRVSVLVDAGANTECTAEQLFQFGVMGAVYLECAYEMERPALGVIANGTEASKGTELTRATVELLEQTDFNVVGHAEPGQFLKGEVNVGVTDGFTGNLILKTGEAAARLVRNAVKHAFVDGGAMVKIGGALARKSLKAVGENLDPREHGAAPLLGLKAPAFIGHGSSDAYAIQTAIRRARNHVAHDVTANIAAAIERYADLTAQRREDAV